MRITEELCGHEFSASAVSEINKKLDEELTRFMTRRLEEEYPYLILDARYERVRENASATAAPFSLRWVSAGTVAAMCSPSNWRTARAPAVGKITSCV